MGIQAGSVSSEMNISALGTSELVNTMTASETGVLFPLHGLLKADSLRVPVTVALPQSVWLQSAASSHPGAEWQPAGYLRS